MKHLELLAPAKNWEQGREAVNHGADAVYVGAPAFGARVAASNTLQDIERLASYAHRYRAKVFVTANTLLFDDEVEAAAKMLHQLYAAGADAAIIQDLGLLECDLPPIELHASTQTHNIEVNRVHFLEQVGFSRIILARETSLQQMHTLREATHVELEAFVQGALCVSYSGQCYMSQYLSNRSGNRGCCGQPCRSDYDLTDDQGHTLRKGEHLLSLKDFSAAQHLQAMVEAGITSFKIEGRLKDMGYVKNVTAYYRLLLDNLMEQHPDWHPASSGRCSFNFTPDLEKTFNRGFTTYFLEGRQPMASPSTQKSMGKPLGPITHIESNGITIKSHETLAAGDGLCYFNGQGDLEGFLVNHVQGTTFQPNRMPEGLAVGTRLWRNHDQAFERLLQGDSAKRKIDINIMLSDTEEGLLLTLTDEDGCRGEAETKCEPTPAQNPLKMQEQIQKQLSKLGDTPFRAVHIEVRCRTCWFVPISVLNDLRRQAASALEQERRDDHLSHRRHCPTLAERQSDSTPYPETALDYRANVINGKCETFYRRHGVTTIDYGVEHSLQYEGKALMTTKYCLRYELGWCLQGKVNPRQPQQEGCYRGALYLRNNKNRFALHFDCQHCRMTVTPDNAKR